MKKIFLTLGLLLTVLVCGVDAQSSLKRIKVRGTSDTSDTLSGVGVTNGAIVNANGVTSTNGLTVTAGTVDLTGIGTLTIPTDKVTSGAVSGVQTTSGAGDAAKVVKLNSSGVIDSTMYTAGSVSKYTYRTNLTANVTPPAAGTFTNILSVTTTLGSNSMFVVEYQASNNGYEAVGRLTAPGFAQVDCISGAGSGNGFTHCVMQGVLVSNITITAWFNNRGGASDTIFGPTAAYNGSCVATNPTYMILREIK